MCLFWNGATMRIPPACPKCLGGMSHARFDGAIFPHHLYCDSGCRTPEGAKAWTVEEVRAAQRRRVVDGKPVGKIRRD